MQRVTGSLKIEDMGNIVLYTMSNIFYHIKGPDEQVGWSTAIILVTLRNKVDTLQVPAVLPWRNSLTKSYCLLSSELFL